MRRLRDYGLALVGACFLAAGLAAATQASPPMPQMITVTVHAPASGAYNTAFSVAANSSSGLPVVFSSAGSCTNSGGMFTITSGSGTCQVRYDQPGNAMYAPAPRVVETVTAQKADQTIGFEALAAKTYGDPDIAVVALATSNLPTTLTASGSCSISGAIVHLTGAGSCTVTAAQPGDANYNAAPSVSRTFAIARPACTVPNVRSKSLSSAKHTILTRHCRTGKVRYAYSQKRSGAVVAQSPGPGRVRPAGSKVDLVVSRGRRP
jgi:hypothetical protein